MTAGEGSAEAEAFGARSEGGGAIGGGICVADVGTDGLDAAC